MTIIYKCGFDTDGGLLDSASFSMTITRGGESDATVGVTQLEAAASNTSTDSRFLHGSAIKSAPALLYSLTAVYPYSTWATVAFGIALNEAMNAAVSGWSGTPTFTVSLSATTHLYTITISDASAFGVTWGNTGSRFLLGYSGTLSGASTYEATYYPYYYLPATLTELSRVSDLYEPGSIANLAMTDGCAPADSISRSRAPWYLDWYQEYEPKAATYIYAIASPKIFSYSHMFEHLRCDMPFLVDGAHLQTSAGYELQPVCVLRPEGSKFAPEAAHPDWDDAWHIKFQTIMVAYYNTTPS